MSDIKTIQDIFVYGEEEYKLKYNMSIEQQKAFRHIKMCRTEALCYHKIVCESCGYEKITYNSCKDRHCPLYQSFKKEQWTNDRKSEVLGSKYFHAVVTLPKELDNISFYGGIEEYSNKNKFKSLINKAYKINWYSYVKRPFDNADAIIEYLARYTHKIAITNSRIVKIEDNKVFFKHKDYKDNSKIKTMSLEAVEFIRRFLMHILPSKFIKIRYYGICANRNKKTKLKLAQKLTNILNNPLYVKLTKLELLKKITNGKAFLCPVCNKETLKLEDLNRKILSTA